jgi:hypothetical protein
MFIEKLDGWLSVRTYLNCQPRSSLGVFEPKPNGFIRVAHEDESLLCFLMCLKVFVPGSVLLIPGQLLDFFFLRQIFRLGYSGRSTIASFD